MRTTNKYRLFSVRIMILMIVFFVMSFASLWDTVITGKIKFTVWNIIFTLLLFIAGMALFYIAWLFTDEKILQKERETAYEKGKADILNELEKRNQKEQEEKQKDKEEIQKRVETIMTGLKSGKKEKSASKILANMAKHLDIVQGILYLHNADEDMYSPEGKYALTGQQPVSFKKGEGLAGQVAESKSPMIIYDIPEQYFNVESALGSSKPRFLIITPVVYENECIAVFELAVFAQPDDLTEKILQKLSLDLAPLLHTSFAA